VPDDGITWRDLKNDYTLPDIQDSKFAVFNNKILAIGDRKPDTSQKFWEFTESGGWKATNVAIECSDCAEEYTNKYPVLMDGKLYMLGGYKNDRTPDQRIWSTSDGESWQLSPQENNLKITTGAQLVEFNDAFYFLNGGGYSRFIAGDTSQGKYVWSSEDLVNWKLGYQHTLRFEQ
jgi:hypothetical protein